MAIAVSVFDELWERGSSNAVQPYTRAAAALLQVLRGLATKTKLELRGIQWQGVPHYDLAFEDIVDRSSSPR